MFHGIFWARAMENLRGWERDRGSAYRMGTVSDVLYGGFDGMLLEKLNDLNVMRSRLDLVN